MRKQSKPGVSKLQSSRVAVLHVLGVSLLQCTKFKYIVSFDFEIQTSSLTYQAVPLVYWERLFSKSQILFSYDKTVAFKFWITFYNLPSNWLFTDLCSWWRSVHFNQVCYCREKSNAGSTLYDFGCLGQKMHISWEKSAYVAQKQRS